MSMVDDAERFEKLFAEVDYHHDDELARTAFDHVSHGYSFDELDEEDRERWREAVSMIIEAEYLMRGR